MGQGSPREGLLGEDCRRLETFDGAREGGYEKYAAENDLVDEKGRPLREVYKICSVTSKLKGKPVLDLAATVIEDFEFLWNENYFSTPAL
ncbi:uncharacterized protein PV09_04017 [Verruconis gallopava]|uniref:Uncharacterized protein n=1 Tax=Verruconis gallopava TaxID=253628 RepID=A0A0D2AEE8_9PEZI|nr:uncharacterized protein PV09_04017 [Verruconis gallopava]KIW04835.1 hypothetical protein PV09_04017 [Verruconis gallopava]